MDREPTQPSTAIDLLMADHRTVEALFEDFENETSSARKGQIADAICAELTVHATIEEEIFYPRSLAALSSDDSDLIWEATVEHGTLEGLIAVITSASPDDDAFDAHVKVLKEYVNHHVKEEENSMFPKVRTTDVDLEAIGAELLERKQALMAGPAPGRRQGRKGSTGGRRTDASSQPRSSGKRRSGAAAKKGGRSSGRGAR